MILAVVVSPAVAADALRLVTGLVAGGHAVRLLEAGPGRGALSAADDLLDDVEEHLRALADFDVRPEPADAAALRAGLRACASVLRIADPSRPGEPAVLEITDPWLAATSDRELLRALRDAGQVVRSTM